jgi:hypothetical protein
LFLHARCPFFCFARAKNSCTPPPPREAEHAFWLLGEQGAKNGEKRLRRLLTRTPEWAKAETRMRTVRFLRRGARARMRAIRAQPAAHLRARGRPTCARTRAAAQAARGARARPRWRSC